MNAAQETFPGSALRSSPNEGTIYVMMAPTPLTDTLGTVLCGGRSRRFRSPKGEAVLGGKTLFDRALDVQRSVCADVALSGGPTGLSGVVEIADRVAGAGPGAGIASVLRYADSRGYRGIWCTPCDAPFITSEFGRWLCDRAGSRIATIPESRGPLGIEPLFGWYSVAALPTFERCLSEGTRAMIEIVRSLSDPEYLEIDEYRHLGDPARLFFNVNTADDLDTANATLAEMGER